MLKYREIDYNIHIFVGEWRMRKMKIKAKRNFRKEAVIIALLLLSLSTLIPVTYGQALPNQNKIQISPKKFEASTTEDFSIVIHRIKQEDEIDPWPHGEADWQLRMYVEGVRKTYECVGDNVIVDLAFTWEGIITEEMTFVQIKMELLDLDPWPDYHDIADISAHPGGGADNTDDFDSHRGAVFRRSFNVDTNEWAPQDETNDFLLEDTQSGVQWFITSGSYDGSTTTDENDALIWFNVFAGNTPPQPPEKPTGPETGWEGEILQYSTKGDDFDGDQIQFGWDWDGDLEIDEFTGFYDPWEPAITYHSWEIAAYYDVRAIAIDEHGMIGEWSDLLSVNINGPFGKSGFSIEDWDYGLIYSVYWNHFETQELVQTLRNGGNVISAIAALIAAIAVAAGVTVPIAVAIAIALAMVRVGAEVISLMDQGMGIYMRSYIMDVLGAPLVVLAYIWSQTLGGEYNESDPDYVYRFPRIFQGVMSNPTPQSLVMANNQQSTTMPSSQQSNSQILQAIKTTAR